MGRAASLVLDALVESGEVIRKSDKTGRVWFSLSGEQEQAALASPARKRKRESLLPAGWKADAALRQWAREQGCSDPLIDAYEAYFVDWARAGDKVYADWDATFRNAVRGDWGGVRKNFKPGAVASVMKGVVGW